MNVRHGIRLLSIFIACLLCAGGPLWSAQQNGIPRIIFDSDMSSDHDDVGDIAVLHGLASMGECEIIGMMVSSQNGGTPLCMDAINTYYGKPNIPIGVRPDIGGLGEYAGIIASEFPHGPEQSPKDFPLAVNLYRQLLASQPDRSVIIATTGYLNNLQALLQSGPDQFSVLNGMDLVRQKVKLWACAGGAFPSGGEFNFTVEPAASFYVVNNWPTAVTYTGFDIGSAIYTGGRIAEAPTTSPIRRVYVGLKNQYPYPSWGQVAIYQAVRGSRGLWGAVTVGHNICTPTGSNAWSTDRDPTGNEEQAYLLEIVRNPVRAGLDAMFMLSPNDGTPSKPGEPSDLRATIVGGTRIDLQWTDNAYNENGFIVERRINGVYTPIATVGANVTSYSDPGLSATANASYRVKATNAVGDSIYSTVWVYSGWTEINISNPADLPVYTYYQTSNLRIRDFTFRPEHVTLNNDSNHGQNLTIDVDVSAGGSEGNFHVYFFYQDANNWYRLNVGGSSCQFEKRINGTITQIGTSAPVQNIGPGSPFHHWKVDVRSPGTYTFINEGATLLNVSEAFSLTSGRIGLGGWARTPVWENFRFDAGSGGGGGTTSPAITTHPANQAVAQGQTATFSVTATGTAPLNYRWQRNEADIPGASSASYTTPATTAADNGATFRVVVSNAVGSVTSNSATLTVTGGGLDPLIPWTALIHDGGGAWGGSGSTADKAFDGNTATFYDAAAGDGATTGIDVGAGNAATVTSIRFYARAGWPQRMIGGMFEGSHSPTGGYVTLATASSASDTAWTTLMVAGAAPYRYLRYRTPAGGWCNVAEIEFRGSLSTSTAVPPTITAHPADQTVAEGQTATFSVIATGTAPLSYRWQKNGADIAAATSASYTTPATTLSDSGTTFRVIVTNSAGSAISNSATLTVNPSTSTLPSPWVDQDVGTPGVAGTASYSGGTFTASGSGAGITGSSDQFNFTSQPLSGDGEIIGRIAGLGTAPGAMAGVMIRESQAANSSFAFTALVAGGSTAFLSRPSTGGSVVSTAGPAATAPCWVRLVRSGNTFTSSVSSDGVTWTQIGSPVTIAMSANVLIGFAVTSGSNAAADTAMVDSVTGSGGWQALAGATPSPAPSSGGGGHKNCGATGMETLIVLGLLSMIRRRRR